jgi:ATP-dependent Lhr-like helicase
VVYWWLIEREAPRLPPWRELLRVYRRLESRGEIRGGRFVAGFSGEQFALPDAVGLLRETRRRGDTGTWTTVSGADPLNLAGILTPGPKIAAFAGNRVLYRDGIPVASLVAGEVTFFREFDPAAQWQIQRALLHGGEHAPSLAPEIDNTLDQVSAPGAASSVT